MMDSVPTHSLHSGCQLDRHMAGMMDSVPTHSLQVVVNLTDTWQV